MKKGCDECEEENVGDFNASLKERMWGSLLREKKILINCPIDESLIEKAVMQVFAFNEMDDLNSRMAGYERQPIIIYLNSSGGLLDEAFSLISAIKASRTPVITVAMGKCASAAFLILLAGHKRYAQRYAQLMYHQGSAGISAEFSKMMEYMKHWESCQSMVEEYVMQHSKVKKKKLEEIFQHKQDWYLKAPEAIQLGIIDGIWE